MTAPGPSTRRAFLQLFGLGAAASLLAACAPAATPSPTTASAAPKPTEAPKPAATTAPAAAPAAASPAAAPTSAAAPPAAAASPAAQAAPAQARNLGKIILLNGTAPPDPTSHYFNYALDEGFYKELGLDVEIKPFNGDVTALRAMIAGEGDVCWGAFAPILQAYQAGSKIKNISSIGPNLDYLIVAQMEVTRAKDLAGKNVAVSQPGAVSWQVPKMMIEADGGDTSGVNWLSVGGSSARVQAVIAKKADAAALNSSFASRTKQYDFLHEIGDAAKSLPDYIYSWEVVTEDTYNKKKDALQAFVTGSLKGARWGMQNPDKAAVVTQNVLPDQPKDELAAGVKAFADKTYWNPDATLPRKSFDFTVQEMLKSGDLKSPVKYEDVVVTDLSDAAAKALGPYKK